MAHIHVKEFFGSSFFAVTEALNSAHPFQRHDTTVHAFRDNGGTV